jgi:hypothetical protein
VSASEIKFQGSSSSYRPSVVLPHPVPWIRVKLSAAVQDGVIGADAPIMGEVGSSEWRTTLSQKYLDT